MIFVVTFVNIASERMEKEEYSQLINTIKENLYTDLHSKVQVPMKIVSELPITTAGFTDPVINHEQENDWVKRLYEMLIRRNPNIATMLLKGIFTKEEFLDILGYAGEISYRIAHEHGGAVTGTAVGGIVGAAVGGIVGAVGGPFGAAFGAAIGTAIGARVLSGIRIRSASASLVGAAVGGMIGAVGGPFGAAFGAAIGTAIGARVFGVYGIRSG